MSSEKIEVKTSNHERRFVRCYLDFLDSELLTGEEKIIFLILKRFLDVRIDQGDVYPSLATVCRLSGMSEKTVRKHLKSLQKKGVVTVKRRGLNKTNLYLISDKRDMWKSQTIEELRMTAEETAEEKAVRYLRGLGYTITKEKEPDQVVKPTTATAKSGTHSNNHSNYKNTSSQKKSQATKNAFHNFEQRDYDYDELEKRLTGKS